MPYRPRIVHASLGDAFFDVVEAARFPAHVLRYRNRRWAGLVGLDGLSETEWVGHFGRFAPLEMLQIRRPFCQVWPMSIFSFASLHMIVELTKRFGTGFLQVWRA